MVRGHAHLPSFSSCLCALYTGRQTERERENGASILLRCIDGEGDENVDRKAKGRKVWVCVCHFSFHWTGHSRMSERVSENREKHTDEHKIPFFFQHGVRLSSLRGKERATRSGGEKKLFSRSSSFSSSPSPSSSSFFQHHFLFLFTSDSEDKPTTSRRFFLPFTVRNQQRSRRIH